MKVLYKDDIRAVEAAARATGFTEERMMENAGSAAAKVICEKFQVKSKRVSILAGNGNNGGDGFVVARKLYEEGADVSVILLCGMPKTETAHKALIRLSEQPIRMYNIGDDEVGNLIKNADIVVDAVFGIGFHGELQEQIASIFDFVSLQNAAKIALDLPSGCECDRGAAAKSAFNADVTISFIAVKPCHVLYPAQDNCGKLVRVGIGLNSEHMANVKSDVELIDSAFVERCLPKMKKSSHKGNCGKVTQLCGSFGMAGAAILSARAAQHSGAGLVRSVIPKSIYPIVAQSVPEAVFTVCNESPSGTLDRDCLDTVIRHIAESDSVLIGCGLGNTKDSEQLLLNLLPLIKTPLIIDADGINIVANNINILKECNAPMILTPHPAEMARLIGKDTAYVQANRFGVAKAVAVQTGTVVVLKGANSVVAAPNGKLFVCMHGNPGMATAGSGDVLAGIISSLVAEGVPFERAAICGVHIHACAGDIGAAESSMHSLTAGDIINSLGKVFSDFE